MKRSKKPRDFEAMAAAVVAEATSGAEPEPDARNPAAVANPHKLFLGSFFSMG